MKEENIFHQVLDQPPNRRQAFLDAACGGDADLRNRVAGLLKAEANPGSFLQSPAICATLDQPQPELAGKVIGPYKLLEQIGEGGMGLVYMAEQGRPVRRLVALKLVKPGMDTKQVLARFDAERQALAMMDHPNIAKIYDAGMTGEVPNSQCEVPIEGAGASAVIPHSAIRNPQLPSSGRPYFVMELVKGLPITQYCDEQDLPLRERLQLFQSVCSAVQHAHQKGIIHRDLKPTNVMVTPHDGRPVVKVIDFGIAKATSQPLTERTLFTAYGQLVGTPAYMSPEQAELNALDVDTRTDVYSLGVLLYELLTGTTPFDKDCLKNVTFDELRRIIREEEPETVSQRLARTRRVGQAAGTAAQRWSWPRRPTTENDGGPALASSLVPPYNSLASSHQPLAPRISELDWIVSKSLEKDRTRRYESASALAADIQRYLSDEPVLACPPSTMYRFQKFARKHKPALITAAAIALCLLLGTGVSAWQAVRATTAEAHAQANAQNADEKAKEATQERDEAQKQRDEVKALADKLAAKEQQLQRTLYAAHMNLAHNAFEAGAPARLRELLAQHRPQPGEADLRGFEWYYLNRLYPTDLLVLKGHAGPVNCVVYSPDGRRLATTGNFTLRVWDAQTGELLHMFPAATPGSCAFSPDGKRIASGSAPLGFVKIWDTETGQELRTLDVSVGAIRSLVPTVAFSPDGKRLAAGLTAGGQIMILDSESGDQLFTLPGSRQPTWCVAFSPDGKRLASGSRDHTVKLWDLQTRDSVFTLQGHTASVQSVAFSSDGKWLASASDDKTVKLWDTQTGAEIRALRGHSGHVRSVTFSPDGKSLASGSADSSVRVWDAATGEELFALTGNSGAIQTVAFSPDGKHLASGSDDNTVKIREAKATVKARTVGGDATAVTNLAFSLDGKRLATAHMLSAGGGGGNVKVWNIQTGGKLLDLDARILASSSFSNDGRRFAAVTHRKEPVGGFVPNADVWELESGEKRVTIPWRGENKKTNITGVSNLALSPDGKRLAIAGGLREMRIWNAETGELLLTIPDGGGGARLGPNAQFVFSPDGQYLAGTAQNNTVKLWNAQSGEEILSLRDASGCLAFSSDGKRLAMGSSEAPGIKLWDLRTGQELLALQGHSGLVSRLAFSPDCRRLASTATDGTLRVWDAQMGDELLTLEGHNGRNNGLAFSPDGNRLAAGGPGGTVLIYDATPLPEKP